MPASHSVRRVKSRVVPDRLWRAGDPDRLGHADDVPGITHRPVSQTQLANDPLRLAGIGVELDRRDPALPEPERRDDAWLTGCSIDDESACPLTMAGCAYDAKRAPSDSRDGRRRRIPAAVAREGLARHRPWSRRRPGRGRGGGLEIAGPRCGNEGVNHLPLHGQIGIGLRRLGPHRRRARLASCRAVGVRSTMTAISSKPTPKTSWSTNASRSGGDSVSSTTSSAMPTESAIGGVRSGFDSARMSAPATSRAAPAATCRHTSRASTSGCGACPGRSDRP